MIKHEDEDVSNTDGSRERTPRALSAREVAEHFSKSRREPLRTPEAHAPPEPSIDLPVRSASPAMPLSKLRQQLLRSVPMWGSDTWAQALGIEATEADTQLRQYRDRGLLFSVRDDQNEWYPCFQFDNTGMPLPAIVQILNVVPADARGWPLLSWFAASNALLDGRRPLELLEEIPMAVRNAAIDFYGNDD